MTIDLHAGPEEVIAPSDHGVETLLMAQRLRDAGRSRMGSNDSENSGGSARSGDSKTLQLPGINLIPGSAPGSRASSFRENRNQPSSSSSSSRRSPTPRQRGVRGGVGRRGADTSSGNVSNASSNSNQHHQQHNNNNKDSGLDAVSLGQRRSSMPNVAEHFLSVPHHHGASADRDSKLRRVRSFKTTSKGVVVNRGDSFKKKSTHSLMSTGSAITEATRQLQQQQQQQQLFLYQQQQHQQHLLDSNSPYLADVPPPIPTYYRVIMMGSAGCGKSQMTKQFMTSDYVDGYEDTQ
ncbi:GTP-binding protein RAD, partial [Elysia marginata]